MLTAVMILIFLGSVRATLAVLLSIPLSALAAFMVLNLMGATINTMVLGGLALAFSRLIDNSVVVLENIFRHLEMGEPPEVAAEKGGREVALPVLAATFTTAIVFFPVVFLYGVSRFLFTALALSVVLSLFASYAGGDDRGAAVLRQLHSQSAPKQHDRAGITAAQPPSRSLCAGSIAATTKMLITTTSRCARRLLRPVATVAGHHWASSCSAWPLSAARRILLSAHRSRAVRHQRQGAHRHPAGSSPIKYIERVEEDIRSVVPPKDLGMIVSNIGITPDFSSIYTSNSGQHTAFVQVSLKEGHSKSSFAYMNLVRAKLRDDLPELSTYFQTGGLVDAVVNLGLPAPIDIQVSGNNMHEATPPPTTSPHRFASCTA